MTLTVESQTLIYTQPRRGYNIFMARETIAVDFDGVVHDYKHPLDGRKMGAPIEGAKDAIARLRHSYKIIIFCVWAGTDQGKKVIMDWMEFYEIAGYDEITNIKPNAKFYIDDRAVRFTNWLDTLNIIDNG